MDHSTTQAIIKGLEEKVARLQESNRDLEHFAYVASHDLQAPLRTIKRYLGLIHRSAEGHSSESEDYFQHVFAGVRNLEQLISDLLDYSRAGRNVERQLIKTVPMLEIVKYNLRDLLKDREVQIESYDLPEEFTGHRTSINQLFENLLSNAILFGKADGANQVVIKGFESEDSWGFSVSDQGVGIAKEDQQRIFDLFTRLVSREFGDSGTGVGLALCKRITEAHGGRIWLESTPGEGSTFYCSIKKQALEI